MFGKEKPVTPTPGAVPAALSGPTATPSAAGSKIETVIGPNASFRGTIQSDGGIRVQGVFEGQIETAGNLIIDEGAKVIAELVAHNVSIAGAVKGNISANRVEIAKTGRVWGDLVVKSFLLDEGAFVRGQVTMQGNEEPPLIEAPRKISPTVVEVVTPSSDGRGH